LKKYKTVKN